MRYTQLTQEQRYHIAALKKVGCFQYEIAAAVGVDKATISRELRRNQGQRGYRPNQAHHLAIGRRQERAQSNRLPADLWPLVTAKLKQNWSPEQIAGWLRRLVQEDPEGDWATVSHEWIYQYVYDDQRQGGSLHKHLRCQKQRRKRYGSYDRRGQLPNRRSIDDRPGVVADRSRIGDVEVDRIVGSPGHQHSLLTVTERKTSVIWMSKLEQPTATATADAMVRILEPVKEHLHTITSDNGREFSHHQQIEAQLNAQFYFAHPYSAWERGANENANGLVRQYFPKGTDFSTISREQVEFATHQLNNRPRKKLGYLTPNEAFTLYSRPPTEPCRTRSQLQAAV